MTRAKVSLSFVVILLVGSLFTAGCSENLLMLVRYLLLHKCIFVVDRPNGFVAYVPEGSVSVGIKVKSDVTEPYVEFQSKESYYGMGRG